MTNQVILVGRLIEEPTLLTSKRGRLFAKARIVIGRGKKAPVVPIVLGGQAAEVMATEIQVGDWVRIRGSVTGHGTSKSDSIALICSEHVQQVGKENRQ